MYVVALFSPILKKQRVEEHHLPLLCYLHLGAPKIWYGIPGRCIDKFDVVMKSLPENFVGRQRSHRGMVSMPFSFPSFKKTLYWIV